MEGMQVARTQQGRLDRGRRRGQWGKSSGGRAVGVRTVGTQKLEKRNGWKKSWNRAQGRRGEGRAVWRELLREGRGRESSEKQSRVDRSGGRALCRRETVRRGEGSGERAVGRSSGGTRDGIGEGGEWCGGGTLGRV